MREVNNFDQDATGRQTVARSSLSLPYHLLRFLLGFAVCFWLWAKWLFSPQMFFLPPLPPVEVLISLVERVLGLWLVALIPLWGAVLIGWDGLESRRTQRLGWWGRRLLWGSAEAVVIHVVVWVVGSFLFYALLALLPGSDVKGRALSDPVVQGLILFCAFLSLIVAGPLTAIIVAARGQGLRRRDGFPPTHLQALNNTWTILLVPLLVLWVASGYPREILRPFTSARETAGKEAPNALVLAARQGETRSVQALLRHGAQPNTKDASGTTALIAAGSNGYGEIVGILLSVGADVNAKSLSGDTALMSAARGGHAEIVRRLVKAGARVEAKDKNGNSALNMARALNHPETVRALREAGARD
jgi:hypothetical protein